MSADLSPYADHTPGPWSWQRQPHCFRLLSANGTDAGLAVKILSAEDEVFPNSSNARLIAAAPMLLRENAALRAALEAIVDHADMAKESGVSFTRFNFDSPAMAQARAALSGSARDREVQS
jgi:hypothetical protein